MRTLAVVTIAALALGGCAAGASDLDAPDSPVALNDWDGGPALQALLEGTLELRDGCLVVVSGEPFLVSFPRSRTEWNAETETLTYAGEEFQMGDAVAAGGGGSLNLEDFTIPEACEAFTANGIFSIMGESIAAE